MITMKTEVRTRTYIEGTAVDEDGQEFTWTSYKTEGRGGYWQSQCRPIGLVRDIELGEYFNARGEAVKVSTDSIFAIFNAIDSIVKTPRA